MNGDSLTSWRQGACARLMSVICCEVQARSRASRTSRLMWWTTFCSRYFVKDRLGYSGSDAE
eukprot:2873670-Prymnesium_polylepis.1